MQNIQARISDAFLSSAQHSRLSPIEVLNESERMKFEFCFNAEYRLCFDRIDTCRITNDHVSEALSMPRCDFRRKAFSRCAILFFVERQRKKFLYDVEDEKTEKRQDYGKKWREEEYMDTLTKLCVVCSPLARSSKERKKKKQGKRRRVCRLMAGDLHRVAIRKNTHTSQLNPKSNKNA